MCKLKLKYRFGIHSLVRVRAKENEFMLGPKSVLCEPTVLKLMLRIRHRMKLPQRSHDTFCLIQGDSKGSVCRNIITYLHPEQRLKCFLSTSPVAYITSCFGTRDYPSGSP
jgi:hypothetical protein